MCGKRDVVAVPAGDDQGIDPCRTVRQIACVEAPGVVPGEGGGPLDDGDPCGGLSRPYGERDQPGLEAASDDRVVVFHIGLDDGHGMWLRPSASRYRAGHVRRALSVLLLTAAAGLAHADGSDGSAAPAASKKIPEEQPVPTTPLIIAGVALAAFAILLLVGRRTKHRRAQQQPQRLVGDLAEVRLVIETDESAVVTTQSGSRVSTDRLGEAVLNLPVGTHEVTIEVGAETFQRSIHVPSVRKMRMPINLTKERISRASSGQMPVIAHAPKTSAARAYPDSATQSELGTKLAGLIDVELDAPAAPRKPSPTKSPLNLDYSAMPAPLAEPVLPAAPGPLELDVEEDLDLQLPVEVPATAMQLPPQPARPSPLAGAPPSAPEQRSNPLRDVVVPPRVKTPSLPPRVTKAERQQAANAVADFAVDGLVAASPADLSIGPIPDLDLAPPAQQARTEAPRTYVDIGDFAIGELGEPQPAPALELDLPVVTAASVADLELDLPVRAIASELRKGPTPDINDFELTPAPAAPPTPPTRATRSSISPSGSLVGNRYRKTGGAGAGVLGALYRGRDENAERDVWIEELPREATLSVPIAQLAKLEHPNILRFYDHVTDATKSYLITELVEGKSLEQLISELGGVVSSLQAIAIVDQVCAALGFAHQHGVFHRNVRPACVWISGRTARLTGFGLTYGKPTPYQAPELATGAPADVRSDLYSVGMVLAQLLTGTVPSTSNVEFPPDVPRSMVGMIRKLISREVMIRPNSVKLVRDAFSSMF